MKEILNGAVLREVKCIHDSKKYKAGDAVLVFIQVMVDTKGIAIFGPNVPGTHPYETFESVTEFLSYFKTDDKTEERLKNIENEGFIYSAV